MLHIFCRCNSGHYFIGEACPWDGWSSPETTAVVRAGNHLRENGIEPTIRELRKNSVSEEGLSRVVVMEFGSEDSTFDAISPNGWIYKGRVYHEVYNGRANEEVSGTRDLPLELL